MSNTAQFFQMPKARFVPASADGEVSTQVAVGPLKPLTLTMFELTPAQIVRRLLLAVKEKNFNDVEAILKNLPDSLKKDPRLIAALEKINSASTSAAISALLSNKIKQLSATHSVASANTATAVSYRTGASLGLFASAPTPKPGSASLQNDEHRKRSFSR